MPITTIEEADQAITALQTAIQHLLRKDIGLIVLCATAEAPSDCVPCDGTEYKMDDPANKQLRDLFAKLGNTFGGDGVNTFRVPDLRGEFLRAWDNGRGVDAQRAVGSFQDWTSGMPRKILKIEGAGAHNHGGNTGTESQTHSHSASTNAQLQGGPNTFDKGDARGVAPTAGITVSSNDRSHTHRIPDEQAHSHPITGGDSETRPRNIALAAFIRF